MNNLSLITREMCRLISSQIKLEFKIETDCQPIQTHVDFILDAIELSQTLDDLSVRVLTPASYALVERMNRGNARYSYSLPLPNKEFDCSLNTYNGCCIRGILDRQSKIWLEDGTKKIGNLFRFDMLWSA